MSALSTRTSSPTSRQRIRQVLSGLVVLPLSTIPFLAYGLFTAEGRTLRDRLVVAVARPKLPDLSLLQQQDAAAMAPRYQGKVMALAYHGVGSDADVVSPRRFGEQLATLRAADMVTVTAQDVARALGGGPPLPDNAVMITFDGGRADALLFADPLLEQAGMKATMFLVGSNTDRANLSYASWDSIEKAARSGRWDIETLAGQQTGEPPTTDLARIQEDLDRNIAAIEDHVGQRPVAFAYPFGGLAVSDILRDEVAARYAIAFRQPGRGSAALIDPGQDRFRLDRLEVRNWSGADLLGRIRHAADPAGTGAIAAETPADDGSADLELVAPSPPPDPDPSTTTTTPTIQRLDGLPDGGRPSGKASEPKPPAKPLVTTTSTGPATATTATLAPTTTSTAPTPPSSTTTTTWQPRPTTTTTTRPPATTTTTTQPSDPPTTTTTTTEDLEKRWKEWCRQNPDHRYCRR